MASLGGNLLTYNNAFFTKLYSFLNKAVGFKHLVERSSL